MSLDTRSALSTYRTLVKVVWVGLILFCAYLAVGVPLGAMNPRLVRPMLGVNPWSPGLVLAIPWESLTPAQWRSFCLSVGLWSLAGGVAALAAVDQIRRILSGTSGTTPFTAVNARRVRNAGIATLGAAGAKALRDIVFGSFVSANVKVPGAQLMYGSDLGLSTAFIGLMVLAVAEVMRHGVRLQEEQDLTV